jgi:hypothetical protein
MLSRLRRYRLLRQAFAVRRVDAALVGVPRHVELITELRVSFKIVAVQRNIVAAKAPNGPAPYSHDRVETVPGLTISEGFAGPRMAFQKTRR